MDHDWKEIDCPIRNLRRGGNEGLYTFFRCDYCSLYMAVLDSLGYKYLSCDPNSIWDYGSWITCEEAIIRSVLK